MHPQLILICKKALTGFFLVVCDKAKLDDRGCKGSPDLVVEIVSPSTFRKDLKEKFNLYKRVGVRDYWIIYPDQKTISVFTLTSRRKIWQTGNLR